MIRVVLDANVLISAALARDTQAPSVRLFDAATTGGRIEAVSCPALLGEIASVLGRDRLRRYMSLEEALSFVNDLAALTTLVADPTEPYPAICRDPADDYLLALARETMVDVVVSGDRDLLALRPSDITIVTPRELIESLEREI